VRLAEFAQVLPRRAVTLPRVAQVQTVRVRGPVPHCGPMTYANDSAHLNNSFVAPPGAVLESGRNKMALVLRTRSASIDSDLAWSDAATLASSLALPPGATVKSTPGRVVVRGAAAAGLQAQVAQQALIDPVIWQAGITLAAFSGKGRLVLREFERYYADHTIPDKRGDLVYRKRVVQERLVDSEFFPLN
jgi:hypothetical protein